ncbi:MAG: leucine-rich repeat domain-containing protein [Alloprevotella sp.]|nr:leucine-rich repeat domain-containing protein [Alloprevotella sp.]
MKIRLLPALALAALSLSPASMVAQVVTVELEEPGTLSSKIDPDMWYTMRTLTVKGPINGTDIKFLRDVAALPMSGATEPKGKLTTLNLKAARIVPGGDVYFASQSSSGRYYECVTRKDTVGHDMFYRFINLKSLTIPDNTVYIDSTAICYTGITSFTIPPSVKGVGMGAFEINYELTRVTIPEGVESFGLLCFYHCDKLKSISFPNSVKELGEGMFNYCDALSYVKLPDNLEVIPMACFENTHALETLNLPTTLRRIEERAFMYCSGLQSVNLPDGLEYIGPYAFSGCSELRTCLIPASTQEIGYLSFAGTFELGGIQLAEENPNYCTIDGSLFSKDSIIMYQLYNGSMDTTYVMPPMVQEIAYEGCGYNYYLKHLTLSPALRIVSERGIDFCYQLQDLTCPAEEVPDCVGTAFDAAIQRQAVLYVPRASLNAYKRAPQWKDFDTIRPIEGTPTAIPDISLIKQGGGARYDTSGRRLDQPVHGINIIRNADGTTRKVYVK